MISKRVITTVAFPAVLVILLAAGQFAAAEQVGAAAENVETWKAAPYWMPPALEAHGRRALAAGPVALPFIALPPCRLVDTRGNGAPLQGGFLPAATVRNYTLTGVCGVPANAQAISLNATAVKPVGPGFLVLYPQGGTFPPVSTLNYLGNDVIVNAAVVPLSVTGGIAVALGVSGGDVLLDTNGYYATVPTVTSLNALTGDLTLQGSGAVTVTPGVGAITISAPAGVTSVTGTNGISVSPASGAVTVTSNATSAATAGAIVSRDAFGDFAVRSISLSGTLDLPTTNSLGSGAISLGGGRFLHNFGFKNTFLGIDAGNLTLTFAASYNVGVGTSSLGSLTTGTSNTAVGPLTLDKTTDGDANVAVGLSALSGNTTGSQNTAVGAFAGFNLTSGRNNVYIGNPGLASESNTIRIGSGFGGITDQHTAFFVAAVRGVTTAIASGVTVLIDSNGQLGTISSSIRFKDDVRDMGDESAKLMQLRPVTFRYKAHGPDGPKQYGLIAEEVDAVMPELVARNKDGEIETVMYHELPALLLNEIQRLEKRIADLERQLAGAPKTQER